MAAAAAAWCAVRRAPCALRLAAGVAQMSAPMSPELMPPAEGPAANKTGPIGKKVRISH